MVRVWLSGWMDGNEVHTRDGSIHSTRPRITKLSAYPEVGGSQISSLFHWFQSIQTGIPLKMQRRRSKVKTIQCVKDRTWISFRLKWLFCSDCSPRPLNPLIRLFVAVGEPITPCEDGDKLRFMLLLLAARRLLLAPPIVPKLVSIVNIIRIIQSRIQSIRSLDFFL